MSNQPTFKKAPAPLDKQVIQYRQWQIVAERQTGLDGQAAWVAVVSGNILRPFAIAIIHQGDDLFSPINIASQRHTEAGGKEAAIAEAQAIADWVEANDGTAAFFRELQKVQAENELQEESRWLQMMRRALLSWREGSISDEVYAYLVDGNKDVVSAAKEGLDNGDG